jgi:hypothetical protein
MAVKFNGRRRVAGARRPSLITMATLFEEQNAPSEIVIPEDLTTLSDEELAALTTQAREAFDAGYGDGQNLSTETITALAELTVGIEALQAETTSREEAAGERAEAAAALAARVRGDEAPAADAEAAPAEGADAEAAPAEGADAEQPEAVVAAGAPVTRGEQRIALSSVNRRPAPAPAEGPTAPAIADYMTASAEGLGVAVGTGLDMLGAGAALNRRLQSHNVSQFAGANQAGRHMREQHGLLSLARPIPADLRIESNDPQHVRDVFDRAGDESRLEQGSLVAAGGWCAPSEVLYDLIDGGESRDGLLSIAEVGVPRGGLSFTTGIDFADIFQGFADREIGFSFTEEDDVAGRYAFGEDPGDPNVVGPKPCYRVECPPFEEYRLDVDGLCIQSGLLQQRGYPEVLADTIRKVLIAHDHYVNGKQIAQIAAGSTAVTLPATQAGTAAPVLSAIELQVEHYRYARRLGRGTTLEAVFPFWIRGAIRSDLSRRLGVDMLSVPDSRIDAWFRERGINPTFVYNWQAISGAATGFTSWPTTVSFLLYAAGTWIKGVSDIITLDTIYDSVLLGNNDFTALFSEEGWFVAKRGQDSRMVTTSLTADGVTAIGQDIAHNGTLVPAA